MEKYTNSALSIYTKQSPNHRGERTHEIDTITIHCVVGHISLMVLGEIFASKGRNACSNYGIDSSGNIGMFCEEQFCSKCSSSNDNDQRAITIEVASDTFHPYRITTPAMSGLIGLCVDICKRNNIPELLWKADKALIGNVKEQNLTVHRWFANKSCPGDYIYEHLSFIAATVNTLLDQKNGETP